MGHSVIFARAVLLCLVLASFSASVSGEGRLGAYRTQVLDGQGEPIALFAEDKGEGRPVLLLHGLGASTFTWRHILPALAANKRVIALDLKGFGRSSKPFDQAYSAQDQAELVAAFIKKRRLHDITIIGHSFGGAVGLRAALLLERQAGTVRNLVLIDSPVLPGALPPIFEFVLAPGVPEAILTPLPPDLVARQILHTVRANRRGITKADIEGYAAPYYELGAKHAFLATARSAVGDKDETLEARLRTLPQPVLLVWCRKDDVVPLAEGRRLAKVLPNANLKTLRACNHLPQDERPKALLSLIQPFLDR